MSAQMQASRKGAANDLRYQAQVAKNNETIAGQLADRATPQPVSHR